MAQVTISGLPELRATLAQFSDRRFAATIATALTRAAVLSRDDMRQQLGRVFDRPTPYTINSLFIQPAKADRLVSTVKFKDDLAGSGTPATNYLMPQVVGGQRRTKRFEQAMVAAGHMPQGYYAVPGPGATLDAYGNVSRGQIVQILSQLRITMTSGFTRNMPFDPRKQVTAQRRAGGRFFVIKPTGKAGGPPPGVYQREFIGRNVTPVLIFVRRVAYQPRFDFDRMALERAQFHLPAELTRAVDQQIAKLAARAARVASAAAPAVPT
jgi:hypothetical protein